MRESRGILYMTKYMIELDMNALKECVYDPEKQISVLPIQVIRKIFKQKTMRQPMMIVSIAYSLGALLKGNCETAEYCGMYYWSSEISEQGSAWKHCYLGKKWYRCRSAGINAETQKVAQYLRQRKNRKFRFKSLQGLGITQRRLYDILNVMRACKLIEKHDNYYYTCDRLFHMQEPILEKPETPIPSPKRYNMRQPKDIYAPIPVFKEGALMHCFEGKLLCH